MSIMAAFKTEDSDRGPVWDKVVVQAKWRSEMGAFLAMSPQVPKRDRIGLNLHLHAIDQLIDGYNGEHGWCGACLDMGLMQLVSRIDGINQIASRYPAVAHQYKKIRQKAYKNGQTNEPKTKFVQTWKGHFRQPLLDEFVQMCNQEERAL